MNLRLIRDLDNGRCTLGTLQINSNIYQTLERPWIAGPPGGMKGVSCIPVGVYRLALHNTEAHPRSFAMVNESLGVYHFDVPPGLQGRTACLIHVANFVTELRGCIALGMEREKSELNGEWCVRRSRVAIDRFYAAVPWVEGHVLEIT